MTAKEIASKAANLAAVTPSVLKLIGLLKQSGLANEDVVEVLKHDTVLTAKLLRACNSPSLGFAEPISSVNQAVLLLGYQQILQMVFALTFRETLIAPLSGYAVEANELWRHSLIVAVASELVSHSRPGLNAEPAMAFTAGLLHDIGKLAINQALTPESQAAIRCWNAEHGASRLEAERGVLGTDHAEVGGYLLNLWRLPEEIVEAVANHHDPVLEPRCRLSCVVYLANCLAHLAGSAPGCEADALKMQSRVTTAFELTPETLEGLVIQVRESCERAESLMVK
jgi:putative nucleotidyltransferase with HDIG domain